MSTHARQRPHTQNDLPDPNATTTANRLPRRVAPESVEALDALHIAFLDYALYQLEHSPQTVRTYRAAYANFRHFLLDTAVALPTPERLWAVSEWKAWNMKRGIKKITNNQYWRMLKPFFKYVSAETGRPNPFLGLRQPKIPREEDRIPKALDVPDMQKVLDAARHYPWRTDLQRERAVAVVAIMMLAGLRKGEVLRLKYADVLLRESKIHIQESKGGGSRVVDMPAVLRVILARYRDVRDARFRAKGKEEAKGAPATFFISKNNRPLSESQFRRIIRLVRLSAGVPFFAHALRHSYISLLFRMKAASHVVQQLAGHRDLATTQRYLACFDEEKQRAVARLSRALH